MSYQTLLSLLTRSHKNLSYDLLSHDTWATAGSYRGHESWLSDLSDPTVPNVSPALPNIRFQEYSSDYILICCLHWGWMCFQEYISLDHLSHETQDPKRISSGFSLLMSQWNGEKNHVSLVAKIIIAVTSWLSWQVRTWCLLREKFKERKCVLMCQKYLTHVGNWIFRKTIQKYEY